LVGYRLEQDRFGLNRSCSASSSCRMIVFGEVVSTSPDHALGGSRSGGVVITVPRGPPDLAIGRDLSSRARRCLVLLPVAARDEPENGSHGLLAARLLHDLVVRLAVHHAPPPQQTKSAQVLGWMRACDRSAAFSERNLWRYSGKAPCRPRSVPATKVASMFSQLGVKAPSLDATARAGLGANCPRSGCLRDAGLGERSRS
jgi:hypothetical protein